MKIRIHTSAEAASYLIYENKLFSTTFIEATINDGVVVDVMFPPSADSETIAMAFFLAGQDFSMKQIKKIFSNDNSLPTQSA